MLTWSPTLVALSAKLLVAVLRHNEPALARLFLTGAPYFALAYCGSNLAEVSELLALSHLVQDCASVAGGPPGAPLARRSFLGHVLPESLLHVMVAYGPAAFAKALAGEDCIVCSPRHSRSLPRDVC